MERTKTTWQYVLQIGCIILLFCVRKWSLSIKQCCFWLSNVNTVYWICNEKVNGRFRLWFSWLACAVCIINWYETQLIIMVPFHFNLINFINVYDKPTFVMCVHQIHSQVTGRYKFHNFIPIDGLLFLYVEGKIWIRGNVVMGEKKHFIDENVMFSLRWSRKAKRDLKFEMEMYVLNRTYMITFTISWKSTMISRVHTLPWVLYVSHIFLKPNNICLLSSRRCIACLRHRQVLIR